MCYIKNNIDFKIIPEKTLEKVQKAKRFKQARKNGEKINGLDDWNIRWVGTEGYKGIVGRQMQKFKKDEEQKRNKINEDLV